VIPTPGPADGISRCSSGRGISRRVQLDLLPFGEQAPQHFLFLERPEGMDLPDAPGFVPA
jgi:hypothetical protein